MTGGKNHRKRRHQQHKFHKKLSELQGGKEAHYKKLIASRPTFLPFLTKEQQTLMGKD